MKTQNKNPGLFGHVAVEVTCGIEQSHKYYLPYKHTVNVEAIHCPICDRYFDHDKGDYGTLDMTILQNKLEKLLASLPRDKSDEIRDMLEKWPYVA